MTIPTRCDWQIRLALLAFIIGAVPLLAGGNAIEQVDKIVDAQRFVLRDAKGNVRAELGFQAGGPSLILFDDKGVGRAQLCVSADGSSSLIFHDREGHHRATLHVPPDGEPRLELDKPAIKGVPLAAVAVEAPAAPPRLRGERQQAAAALYRQLCVSCHGSDGKGRKSHTRPTIPDF